MSRHSPDPAIVLEDGYIQGSWTPNQGKAKPSPGVPKGRSGSGNGHPELVVRDHLTDPEVRPPSQSSPERPTLPSADSQPHNRSPRDAHRRRPHPESDAGSLNVKLGQSTLNERNANQSTTLTQRSSTSHTLKRPSDEMQGANAAAQPESRPLKQPFSPNLRGPPGRLHTRQSSYNESNQQAKTANSPVAVAAGSPGYYYNVGHASQDPPKQPDAYRPSSPQSDPLSPPDTVLMKQPATRPITEQQLINEVKGIYAGLVMVERKCVDIIHQQNQSNKHLSDQQWKALVALHRTLLQEHHDFFSASQHPSASDSLKKLAIKYAMPARMWRHGIHAFLELLRHRLPDSMEHMLSFIYLAYSMMALLKESVPGFVETWIECLGDLARYRMAIEDSDHKDRETWSNVAKMWYNEAADKSPNVGRIQHHLAVLARPNIVEQLFYYDKALVSVTPFVNARESIMLLFEMFQKNGDAVRARYLPAEYAFVNTSVQLFTRSSPKTCQEMIDLFASSFKAHMDRTGAGFKLQGPQMALAIFAALLDFGKEDSHLWNLYCQHAETVETKKKPLEEQQDTSLSEIERSHVLRNAYWKNLKFATPVERCEVTPELYSKDVMERSKDVTALCTPLLTEAITAVSSRIGDKNQVPTMHTFLANLYDMSFVPDALPFIEHCVPWDKLTLFLNTLNHSSISYANVDSDDFPPSHGGLGKQLPEDFLMRGMMTTRHYYEPRFFAGPLVDEDERNIEKPSHQTPRAERCLWLGVRLAKLGRYFTWNIDSKQFETTEFARSLTNKYVS